MDLGCEVKPASYASYTGSAAWWWRVVWKEFSCLVSSLFLGLVLDRLGRLGLGWCRRR